MPSVFSPALLSSAHEQYADTHILIAPNPTSDFFTITPPWSTQKALTLVVTNMQGNIVLEEKIFNKTRTFDLQRELITRIYIVNILEGGLSVAIEKLVVIR